jgi:hypothetical protein
MSSENITYDMVSENVACVYIYFNELKYTQIYEFPSISPISLISNLGGTAGLFRKAYLLFFN